MEFNLNRRNPWPDYIHLRAMRSYSNPGDSGAYRPPSNSCIFGRASSLMTLSLAAAMALAAVSCLPKKGSAKDQAPTTPPSPVTVADVVRMDIPWEIATYGTIEAYSKVAVKSLVVGKIVKTHCVPGQLVKEGDVLISIDPRPFEANLRQYVATLEKNKILCEDSLRQAELKDKLHKVGVTPEDEMKRIRAAAEALKAAIEATKADIEKSKLDIEYCTITSPVDGRVGDILIHKGNIVKSNDLPIIEIVQIKPIYASFSVSQSHLSAIQKRMAPGALRVEVEIPGEEGRKIKEVGELAFINSSVDVNTGTIKLKAVFGNSDSRLWPGQFVNVSMRLNTEKNVLAVPSQAVQTGQEGNYVYTLGPESQAEYHKVTVGRTFEGFVSVKEGLSDGVKVLTDGHLNVMPGSKVEVVGQAVGPK